MEMTQVGVERKSAFVLRVRALFKNVIHVASHSSCKQSLDLAAEVEPGAAVHAPSAPEATRPEAGDQMWCTL